LISAVLQLLDDILSLKIDVNVNSKSKKQKILIFVDVLKVTARADPNPDPLVRGTDTRMLIFQTYLHNYLRFNGSDCISGKTKIKMSLTSNNKPGNKIFVKNTDGAWM
jgi:hypothetical protein